MEVEQKLSEVLSEFARTMLTEFPVERILDRLVLSIVDILPVTGAGVTLVSSNSEPRYIAASDDSAMRFEELQTELGEGPCLAAYHSGQAVVIPDLGTDCQFPAFGPRAVAAGLGAVFTFPLRQEHGQLGALDLYRDTPGPLDAEAMASAQTLADVVSAYLLNAQARTELRASHDESHHGFMHDALTGLPNRTLLIERLNHAILRGRRSGKTAAVLFIDLDRFKAINDTYSHSVGDEALIAIARRLSAQLRPGDTMARLSGDEFVILCEDLDDPSLAGIIAARIGAALNLPLVVTGAELQITASVGIAFTGQGGDIPEQILHDADIAMYQAKRKGGARHQVVDLRERRRTERRAGLEHDLRGATMRGEMRTVYQPIVRTGDGQITGVEALLRWSHPTLGTVMPAMIIPLAERSGLINEIGRWVLEQACPDRRRWRRQDQERDDFELSVNVSPVQLMAPDFAVGVASVLAKTGTDPELLTLEVTENVFIEDSDRALLVLNDLKDIGVKVALDDFGTGYSSLSYLERFPVDALKIDQGFVARLGHNSTSHAIASAVVGLAHALEIVVIAEGVETAEQYRQVEDLNCESCQGYYFARPMPGQELDALLLGPDGPSSGPFRLPVASGPR